MDKAVKEETAYARQLFLFGEGTDAPIRNLEKLAKRSGCPVRTLRDHVHDWRRESEQLAIRSEKSPFTLSLSTEVVAQHAEEVEFLGEQVRELRERLQNTPKSHANYHVYLSSYMSALTKWEKASGILAHYDTVTAAMKEGARAQARVAAKQGGGEGARPAKGRTVDTTRFDVES
jgi:hypothetical protein